MAEEGNKILQGKNKVLLFRLLSDGADAAKKLVFQTEHSSTYSRDLDKIITKDGVVIKIGELETEFDFEAIQSVNDPVSKMLRDSLINGEKLEMWEVTIDKEGEAEGKYPAVYAQGYLDSWDDDAGAEDESTVSSTFMVELVPQEGMATLTKAQQETVQYAFTDTIKSV